MNKAANIFSKRLWKASFFMVALVIFGWMGSSFAQDRKVDTTVLMQETQKITQSPDEMKLIWWIPEDFWRVSLEQNPDITAKQMEAFIEILRPYTLFVAAVGKMGALGGITYKSESTLQNSIELIDDQGIRYSPLSNEQIDADTKNFLSIMKPFFINMLGPMGQNMHFFLFPAKNKKGDGIAVATKEGAFPVKLDEAEFKWKLPLGSLLPPKVCPVDGNKMSGAWKFCPWHGVELK